MRTLKTFVVGRLMVGLLCGWSPVLLALPTYEPFSYTAGTNLVNPATPGFQTNAWYTAGTGVSGTNVVVVTGNLTAPGLAVSQCNSIQFGGLGPSARLNLTPQGQPLISGDLYFSFLLRVTDLSGLDTIGGHVAGFNNSLNSQAATPGTTAPRALLRAASAGGTNGFNVGMTKASTLSATDWAWDSRVFDTNQTVFLVGRYQFNSSSGIDDYGFLWVNPDPSTFGGTEPATPLSTSAGTDLSGIASFVFLQRSATNEPAAMIADELRIGATWAFVTATNATAPVLNAALSGTNIILSWTTNVLCFALEATPALSPSSWGPVTNSIVVVDDRNTVSVERAGAGQFFRLRSP